MEYKFNTIILLLVFTILLVIIFRTFKDSHQFGSISSLILSVCVSALATIGLNSNIKGMMGAILVPYAALAICILSVVLIAFLFNSNKKVKNRFSGTFKNNPQTNNYEKRNDEKDDKRMRRER